MKKKLNVILIICATIWLLGKCNRNNEEPTTYSDSQNSDCSWIYGTWQLSIGEETHTICFLSNGVCTEHFRSSYGSNNDTSNYTIESSNKRIRIDNGDGYPSYIEIDGKRLITDGKYYKKIE